MMIREADWSRTIFLTIRVDSAKAPTELEAGRRDATVSAPTQTTKQPYQVNSLSLTARCLSVSDLIVKYVNSHLS